jgi:hypothetical protein
MHYHKRISKDIAFEIPPWFNLGRLSRQGSINGMPFTVIPGIPGTKPYPVAPAKFIEEKGGETLNAGKI